MTTDLELAVAEVERSRPAYDKAEQYYEGTAPEVFASTRLRRALRNSGTSFRVNFARTVVSAVLDRLDIAATSTVEESLSSTLQELWDDNYLDEESEDIHRWSLVYGDCYALVWPSEDGGVDIAYNSPKTTRIFYDEERPRVKRFAAKVWLTQDGKTRVNLYYRDRIEKYVSKGKSAKKQGDFEPYYDLFAGVPDDDGEIVPQAVWPIENPFDAVPVFHFRTQRPFGRPEHKDAFGPQDMINKLVITQMASNDFHGFPQRWVLSEGGSSDDATGFEDDETSTDEEPALTSGPGELWWLTGKKMEVGQFDAADPNAFLAPLKEYIKALASATATPLHYFEGMGGQISGEALRSAEAPLIKKVIDRQQVFGSVWGELLGFALMVALELEERPVVQVEWESPQSTDDEDAWLVAKAKQEAGVPRRVTLREAGYTDREIDAWSDLDEVPAPQMSASGGAGE